MKVFVTGSTGFVGREIVRHLDGRGHFIRALARDPQAAKVLDLVERFRAEVYPGDVTIPQSLSGAFQGIDAIIHLAGIISEIKENTFENVHTQGTQNLLKAAQEQGVRRFVHMSALGTRPEARSRYHATKWLAEESVRKSGLDFTIFRPSLIYGVGDGFVNLFAKMIRILPIFPLVGRRDARLQPIDLKAVATAFVGSLTLPESIGLTYDLCGEETFTLSEMIDLIMVVMGKRRPKIPVPARLAELQAMVFEHVFPLLLHQAPPLNRDQLIMLDEDNIGNPEPAKKAFALTPCEFREGIAEFLIDPRGPAQTSIP